MHDKIKKLRHKLIRELDSVPEGSSILLDYDKDILELIIFNGLDESNNLVTCIDTNGNHLNNKVFALPKNILQKIDFSNISFTNFNAKNYDFTGLYGVKIDPQLVYNHDLSFAILNGVTFTGNFDNAIIKGANFTGSTGAIINPLKLYCGNDMIDVSSCIFNSVIFNGSFTNHKYINTYYENYEERSDAHNVKIKIEGCNFTRSINAKIYSSRVLNNSLNNCILANSIVVMPINNKISIIGTNFTDAASIDVLGRKTNIVINLKNILDKNLMNATLNGIKFIGSFEDAIITNTNFTGSIGAYINLKKLKQNYGYENTNFTDAIVTDDNHKLTVLEDGRLSKKLTIKLDELLHTSIENDLINQKSLEDAKNRNIEENRQRIKKILNDLIESIKKLESIGVNPSYLYCKVPITQEQFLVYIDDHYEINRDIVDLSLLRFFNLTLIDFTNVLVRNIDFRKTGARIDPQKVYHKDISGCIFDTDNIKFFDNYDGVIMYNTNFDECDFKPNIKTKKA